MSLLSLPVELLHRICQQFHDQSGDHKHIAALRLVSRAVQAVADEYLVPRLSIHYLREEFDTAEEIFAANPRIAKGVRSIRYHADRLLHLPCIEIWKDVRKRLIHAKQARLASEEALAQSGSACPRRLPERARRRHMRNFHNAMAAEIKRYSKKELEVKFADYQQHFKDQTAMLSEARAVACFERILAMCPKLNSIAVVMLAHSGEGLRLRERLYEDRYCIGPYGDDASTRLNTRPAGEMLKAIHNSGTANRLQIYIEPLSYQFFAQEEDIMTNYYGVASQLSGLHIGINDRCLNQDRVEGGPDPDEDPDGALEALIQSEEDARRETAHHAHTRVLNAFDDKRLAKFLDHASKLTSLTIKAPRPTRHNMRLLSLSNIVRPSMVWPRLTSLSLENFRCEDRELSDLITRHQSTLEVLSLRNVEFTEGDVKSCFEVFAGKMPQLRTVTLRHDFCKALQADNVGDRPFTPVDFVSLSRKPASRVPDRLTRALQRYVLHGGDRFPLQHDSTGLVYVVSAQDESDVDEESSDEESYSSDEEAGMEFDSSDDED